MARGSTTPASASGIDWQRLRRFLGDRGMALAEHPEPRRFPGGFGNLNYLLTVDGTAMVLRRPPFGEVPIGANDMGREHRILSRLWRRFPLAPRSFLLCEDAAVIGAPFQLIEYREGVVIRDALPPSLHGDGAACDRLCDVVLDVLVALHAVDPEAVGLGDFGRPDGFLERTVHGWKRRADAVFTGADLRLVEELHGWLAGHLVPDQTPTLIHNDYKLDNIILSADHARPLALIDWDMGSRGDPLIDLATLVSYWTEAGDPPAMRELRQMPTAADGFRSRERMVRDYAQRTGRDVSLFKFHRLLAQFKLATVFRQLHHRHLTGNADDPRFAGFGPLAAGLLEFARDVMHDRYF
ncbi:MAG TPA: phosphotransferase family protein [Thalassobaculum sp.]